MANQNKDLWPSYGYLSYKGKYFRIHHGRSNKQYADLPFTLVLELIAELNRIEDQSANSDEFLSKAKNTVNVWNEQVKNDLGIHENMLLAYLDKYYWGQNVENVAYGLKIRVNWNIFSNFLKERSESPKSVYKVFEYIYTCKSIFTQKLLEDDKFQEKIETYIERVKRAALEDLNEISSLIQELQKSADNARKMVVSQIRKGIKNGKKPAYILYFLIYINELKLKADTIGYLSEIGDFPTCLSQMRSMIEGLSNHIFWDQLKLNLLKREKDAEGADMMRLFNEDSYKEAMNYNLKIKEIATKSQFTTSEVLKDIVEYFYPTDKEIKDFIVNLNKKMSFASYLLVYGTLVSNSPLNNINTGKLNQSKLYIFDMDNTQGKTLLSIGLQEIVDALKDSGSYEEKQIESFRKRVQESMKNEQVVLIPPTPTLPLRIISYSILSSNTASELKDLYNEFSPFTHSTWETNTIWPFTSVLEIMTFKHNLKKFMGVVDAALNDFMKYFNEMLDSFLI